MPERSENRPPRPARRIGEAAATVAMNVAPDVSDAAPVSDPHEREQGEATSAMSRDRALFGRPGRGRP